TSLPAWKPALVSCPSPKSSSRSIMVTMPSAVPSVACASPVKSSLLLAASTLPPSTPVSPPPPNHPLPTSITRPSHHNRHNYPNHPVLFSLPLPLMTSSHPHPRLKAPLPLKRYPSISPLSRNNDNHSSLYNRPSRPNL